MCAVSTPPDHRGAPRYRDVVGVILAGGRSTRYGRNKAFVRLHGVPLIERVIGVLRPLFPEILLITNTPDEYAHLGLPMHRDLIPGLGPIGGIYTALSVLDREAGFFVACDMPRLNPKLIGHMVEARGDFDAVVPRIGGYMDALHALYTRACLKPVRALIDRRRYQVIRLYDRVSVRYVEEEEIRLLDPHLDSFLNINRPEELERLNKP